jgi:hypothetical protein
MNYSYMEVPISQYLHDLLTAYFTRYKWTNKLKFRHGLKSYALTWIGTASILRTYHACYGLPYHARLASSFIWRCRTLVLPLTLATNDAKPNLVVANSAIFLKD